MAAERDPEAGAARPPGREVPAEGLHPRGLDRRYGPPAPSGTRTRVHAQRLLCCWVCLSDPSSCCLGTSLSEMAFLGSPGPRQQATLWSQVLLAAPPALASEITSRWAPSWMIGGCHLGMRPNLMRLHREVTLSLSTLPCPPRGWWPCRGKGVGSPIPGNLCSDVPPTFPLLLLCGCGLHTEGLGLCA